MLKKNETTDWKMIWELPLKFDDYSDSYAWGNNGTMALTFDDEDFMEYFNQFNRDVVDAINGVKEWNLGGVWTADGCDVFWNGTYVFCARGWGELTSPNCYGFSNEKAAKIQDDFVSYIISKLNVE